MYGFVVLTVTSFYVRGFLVVVGAPIEKSTKHDFSSYYCGMEEFTRNFTTDEKNQAIQTHMRYSSIFIVATIYLSGLMLGSEPSPYSGLKSQVMPVAVVSANLFVKLPVMQDVNNILFDSTWDVCHGENFPDPLPDNTAYQMMLNIRKKIENTMLINPSLASLYKEEKSKFEKVFLPPTFNYTRNDSLKVSPDLTDLYMRQTVLKKASKACYEDDLGYHMNKEEAFRRHYLSKAILQLAKSNNVNNVNRVQAIFDDAIKVLNEKLRAKDVDFYCEDRFFFSTLEEKLKMDSELDEEVMTVKNDLIKMYGEEPYNPQLHGLNFYGNDEICTDAVANVHEDLRHDTGRIEDPRQYFVYEEEDAPVNDRYVIRAVGCGVIEYDEIFVRKISEETEDEEANYLVYYNEKILPSSEDDEPEEDETENVAGDNETEDVTDDNETDQSSWATYILH